MLSLSLCQRLILSAFIAVYFVLSLYVMAIFLVGNEFGGHGYRQPGMISEGLVRPPVYRMLVRTVSKGIIHFTPDSVKAGATKQLVKIRDSRFAQRLIHQRVNYPGKGPMALSDEHIYKTAVVMGVVYAFLLAFVAVLYHVARVLMPESRAYALLAPVVALLALPPFHYRYAHIYDHSMLFFMTAGIYALAVRRWPLFLAVLTLATINRETSYLLILLFAVYFLRLLPRQKYFGLLAAQCIIYAAVKGGITYFYFGNPGTGLFYNYMEQLWNWLHGYWFHWYIGMLVLAFMLFWRWQEKPALLRASIIWWPFTFAGFFTFGIVAENRQLLELLPPAALLITHTLVTAAGFEKLPLFQPRVSTVHTPPP